MAVKLSFKLFHLFVQSMCVLVTAVLACLCFYKFLLDDDLAQVNFQTFNDNNHALYPSVTLCFMGPSLFLEDKLTLLGEGINARNYAHFLKGLLWNNTMSEVDFDDVTITQEQWGSMKNTQAAGEFNCLPIVTVDDRRLGQTNAVLRSLGTKYGCYDPSDHKRAYYIDVVVDLYTDLFNACAPIVFLM